MLRGSPQGLVVASGFASADVALDAEKVCAAARIVYEPYLRVGVHALDPAASQRIFQAFSADPGIARHLRLPKDMFLSLRIELGLFTMLANLEARQDWRTLLREWADL